MPGPRTAILTRPAGRNEALAERLRLSGWEVLVLPMLAIQPLDIAPAALPRPSDYDLVVFVSGNAARLYLDALAHSAPRSSWPAATQAAAVGFATAQALRGHAFFGANTTVLHPSASAPTHDSEALWSLLRAKPMPRQVLLVRGTEGRDWLADRLVQAGAAVTRHAQYRRVPAPWPESACAVLQAWRQQDRQPGWLLTSAESIRAAAAGLRAQGLADWWAGHRFVLTHPRLRLALAQALGDGGVAVVKDCMPADEAIFEAFVAV